MEETLLFLGNMARQNVARGIASIQTTDYPAKSQIATLSNHNELKIVEFNQRAGSL